MHKDLRKVFIDINVNKRKVVKESSAENLWGSRRVYVVGANNITQPFRRVGTRGSLFTHCLRRGMKKAATVWVTA